MSAYQCEYCDVFRCNYCGGGRRYDCKGKYPPKTECPLIDAVLSFEGDDGVWRTPDGSEALRYRRADRPLNTESSNE